MSTALLVLIIMLFVGAIFGLVLAFANKKFAVEVNPLIHVVEDILPKGQCGACGYAGCQAYAEAVVLNPNVAPNLCIPGKEAVAKKVAELTGKVAPEMEPRVAHIRCAGVSGKAAKSYNYEGIEDCVAASLLHGGPKSCIYGCLGFGTCVKQCPFGAMTLNEDRIPVIDKEKCTGCGKCEQVCPKKAVEMIPVGATVTVNCNSRERGAVVRKNCSVACLGCGICAKECPHSAITIENNLAKVDFSICAEKCDHAACVAKCPTRAIELVLGENSEMLDRNAG